MIKKTLVMGALFALSIGLGFGFVANAQVEATATPLIAPAPTTASATTSTTTINVQLPNPIILPGNPFYFLKQIGETIVNWFTFGTVNQAKRALQLAQERLAESQKLSEQNQANLAQQTLQQYQNEIQSANQLAQEAKNSGDNVDSLIENIAQNTLKHQAVLMDVLQKAPDAAKPGIENALRASVQEHTNALDQLPLQLRSQIEEKNASTTEAIQNRLNELEAEGLKVEATSTPEIEKNIQKEMNQGESTSTPQIERNREQEQNKNQTNQGDQGNDNSPSSFPDR